MLASIITPFLPAFVVQSISGLAMDKPATRHVLKRTALIQSPRVPSRHAGPPRSAQLPRTTFQLNSHRRVLSESSLIGSSSASLIPLDDGSPHNNTLFPIPPLPLPIGSPYSHSRPLISLESLDLASEGSTSQISQLAGSNAKRSFRVQMPKLVFGKRRSGGEISTVNESVSDGLASSASETKTRAHVNQLEDVEWRGTTAFAIRRGSTLDVYPAEIDLPTAVSPRRKFTLFSRDTPSSPDNGKDPPINPPAAVRALSEPITLTPLAPATPSPTTHNRKATSVSPDADAGPSNVQASPPASHLLLDGMNPLERTSTPPTRPTRTDPYKMYGVPVPGSERARAFLKAEKEWIKAEKERIEREKTTKAADESGAGSREEPEESERRHKDKAAGDAVRGRDPERSPKLCPGVIKKCLDPPRAPVKPLPVEPSPNPGEEADAESDKSTMEPHRLDELGILPVQNPSSSSSVSQARLRSSQGKRWVFSRRVSDVSGDKVGKGRGKKDKDWEGGVKGEDNTGNKPSQPFAPAKILKRPKSSRDRSQKRSLSFRSKGGGYSSDTGVPSLTYKLM
ncbi:hypothetical protein K439DRAFT_1631889 [Ramaria rubella]|nr:hypothetical protein K439DRAFT_1631889 [Ramaria rubella]